jgi:hypothetical protein
MEVTAGYPQPYKHLSTTQGFTDSNIAFTIVKGQTCQNCYTMHTFPNLVFNFLI